MLIESGSITGEEREGALSRTQGLCIATQGTRTSMSLSEACRPRGDHLTLYKSSVQNNIENYLARSDGLSSET